MSVIGTVVNTYISGPNPLYVWDLIKGRDEDIRTVGTWSLKGEPLYIHRGKYHRSLPSLYSKLTLDG